MREIPSELAGRIFDGFLFDTHRDRALYIRTETRYRKRWLEQNPGKWWRLDDVLQRSGLPLAQEVEPAATIAPLSPALRGDSVAATETQPVVPRPGANSQLTSVPETVNLSPSQIAKSQIEIGSHLYVSAARLASMLGISERTLSRRCANGGGPPHVKLAGTYYELDKIQEWTASNTSFTQ